MEQEELQRYVNHISPGIYLSSKADIVEYYRDTHKTRWKREIIRDLAPITGMKEKNLEKRFDPQRLQNVPKTSREKAQYEQLGKTLPPIGHKAAYGYIATVTMLVAFSKGCKEGNPEERSGTIVLKGKAAQDFFQFPTEDALFNGYLELDEDEEPYGELCSMKIESLGAFDEGDIEEGEYEPPEVDEEYEPAF